MLAVAMTVKGRRCFAPRATARRERAAAGIAIPADSRYPAGSRKMGAMHKSGAKAAADNGRAAETGMAGDTNKTLGDWQALAEKDMKGRPIDDLVWKTPEGLDVKPL
jgi:hypothetical protein